jgi:predicted membrane protein (TIGR00267 family)
LENVREVDLKEWYRATLRRVREYNRLANIAEIARRYFAMNAFDGVLTIIGVLMGNLAAQVKEPQIVVSTGLATCIAMGVSGLWGAYLTEAAERQRDLIELNRYTLTDLDDTRIGRASRAAVVAVAVVDGLSPFLAALLVLIPFFGVALFPTITWAYYTSLGVALLTLFGLGAFLGHTSRGSVVLYGAKTVVAGIVSILISILLGV